MEAAWREQRVKLTQEDLSVLVPEDSGSHQKQREQWEEP